MKKQHYRRHYGKTVQEWLSVHHKSTLGTYKVDGVPVMKTPLDIAAYFEVIGMTKPQCVIEIGTRFGGSAIMFRRFLMAYGEENGLIVSIDISHEKLLADPHEYPDIMYLLGDSADPLTARKVGRLVGSRRCMVVHDGNHNGDHVLRDLNLYSPFVTASQLIVVEDTIMDVYPGLPISNGAKGPLWAADKFLAQHKEFARFQFPERYGITYNPGGYLKRSRTE